MKNKELRTMNIKKIEMETREEGGSKHVAGIIPYDSMSEDLGGFREVIRKGAFTKSLRESDIRCLRSHDTEYVCGRSKVGTLSLEDREDGLHFDCVLPNTSWASDLYESVNRRDAPGVSFGFIPVKTRWTENDNEEKPDLRELLEVRLFEISIGVAFPAYPESDSTASVRELGNKAGINFDVIEKVLSLREAKTDYIVNETDAKELRATIGSLQKLLLKEEDKAQEEESREETEPCEKPSEDTFAERERLLSLIEAEAGI